MSGRPRNLLLALVNAKFTPHLGELMSTFPLFADALPATAVGQEGELPTITRTAVPGAYLLWFSRAFFY